MYSCISDMSPGQVWVLRKLVHIPLASAGDLALWEVYSQSRCGQILNGLYKKGMVGFVRLGATRQVQKRWFLTRAGIRHVLPRHNGNVPWPITESGLKNLVGRLPMLEQFYVAAATFTSNKMIRPPSSMFQSPDPNEDYIEVPTDLPIESFRWLRSSTVHAIAQYHDQIIVPFVWAGLWGLSEAWENSEGQQHLAGLDCRRLGRYRFSHYSDDIEPSAWAVVAMDLWAADEADTINDQPDHVAIYVEGEQVVPVQLDPCAIGISDVKPLGRMGIPERLVRWVEDNRVVAALNGSLAFRAATLVEEWPAGKLADVAKACGESKSKTRKVLRRLVDAQVLAVFDGQYYLGEEGIKAAARRDRVSSKTIRKRFGKFIGESDHSRRQYRIHDRKLLQMVNWWRSASIPVVGGWRGEVVVPKYVTLAPDARIYMNGNFGEYNWHFLEYERSAVTPSQITNKLEGYQTFSYANVPLPLVVICDRAEAEERFWAIGAGPYMVTSTYDRVMRSKNILDRDTFMSSGEPVRVWGDTDDPPDAADPSDLADAADSFSWNDQPDAAEMAAIADRYESIYPSYELPYATEQPDLPDLDETYSIDDSYYVDNIYSRYELIYRTDQSEPPDLPDTHETDEIYNSLDDAPDMV